MHNVRHTTARHDTVPYLQRVNALDDGAMVVFHCFQHVVEVGVRGLFAVGQKALRRDGQAVLVLRADLVVAQHKVLEVPRQELKFLTGRRWDGRQPRHA